jgi:hypothetical protein
MPWRAIRLKRAARAPTPIRNSPARKALSVSRTTSAVVGSTTLLSSLFLVRLRGERGFKFQKFTHDAVQAFAKLGEGFPRRRRERDHSAAVALSECICHTGMPPEGLMPQAEAKDPPAARSSEARGLRQERTGNIWTARRPSGKVMKAPRPEATISEARELLCLKRCRSTVGLSSHPNTRVLIRETKGAALARARR